MLNDPGISKFGKTKYPGLVFNYDVQSERAWNTQF